MEGWRREGLMGARQQEPKGTARSPGIRPVRWKDEGGNVPLTFDAKARVTMMHSGSAGEEHADTRANMYMYLHANVYIPTHV